MNRAGALTSLREARTVWDCIIIGGGATGLGTAVEAASRGYRTLLLEQCDFAKGTSSRSTKLVHGGFRYLRQGHLSLVLESLRERGLLLENAPHLVHRLSFVVPRYSWWEAPYYGAGLKLYDLLAGKLGFGPAQLISRDETLQHLPTLEPHGLRGGVRYYDGQFDDARLAISLVQTLADLDGVAVNYVRVVSLLKNNERVTGVVAEDLETDERFELRGRVVINATGVFTDAIRRMDDGQAPALVTASQGAHIVLAKSFLPGESALMVPKTDDGRVLFAVPWHDRVVVGTTDTAGQEPSLEPRPLSAEIEFLLAHASRYLAKDPTESDILCAFAGLRPLVKAGQGINTARLHRDHLLSVSHSGLVTITGGKWTTYRKMGEDTVDQAAVIGSLEHRPSRTRNLHLHGWLMEGSISHSDLVKGHERIGRADLQVNPTNTFTKNDVTDPWRVYGADAQSVRGLIRENSDWNSLLHPRLPYRTAEVIWGVRYEMARTVEDVLARRTRALMLDARASIESAPRVAALMAKELGRNQQWVAHQTSAFTTLARGYLPAGSS
jgi:glycerol-3-phosphate dehydrogenase